MKRVSTINFRGNAERHHEAADLLKKPGDAALVIRGRERSIVMICPDGCGDLLTINLDPRTGPAWRRYGSTDALTIYPSIWRDSGCNSHFIVWRGKVDWLDSWWWEPPLELVESVKESLTQSWASYFDIAERLGEIPWDVASACRFLVRSGLAEEGLGTSQGEFRRARAADK